MTRSPSEDGFVDRLSGFSFLPPCYPSYRALAFALVRLFLTEYASLPWTHLHAGLSRRFLHASFRPHLTVTPLRFATLHLHQVGTGLAPASCRTCTTYRNNARDLRPVLFHSACSRVQAARSR